MDIEKYISSGILESYVLGIASPDETREAEALAAKHPDIRNEIEAIRKAIEGYAEAYRKTPPAYLKSRILDEIDKLDSGEENKGARVIEMDTTRKAAPSRWLVAATVTLLILSGAINVLQYNKLHEANQKIAALESEKSVLADEFNAIKANYTKTESELAVVTNPNNKMILMKGLEKQPGALASVYWNSQTKETFLMVNSLPVPPADKQYQLWAIVDGKPVDMGVFEVTDSLQKMKLIEGAQAFAVTLEKKGGSAVPTLEQMYVVGNVTI